MHCPWLVGLLPVDTVLAAWDITPRAHWYAIPSGYIIRETGQLVALDKGASGSLKTLNKKLPDND